MPNLYDTQNLNENSLVCGSYSDMGIRKENQDSFLIIKDITNPTFIVADGAGGYSFGKEASKLAVDAFKVEVSKVDTSDVNYLNKLIKKKYEQVNEYIYKKSMDLGKKIMTTFSMVNIIDNKLLISNLGDTAIYKISEGKITKIYVQHSLAFEQYESGHITFKEYINHPKKNVITRALGGNKEVFPYINTLQIYNNDIFIICTDGVYNFIQEQELLMYFKDKIHDNEGLESICKEIGLEVLKRHGNDNLTIVAFQKFIL
ncbi:MAG: protein phosphatase 2C domain-containing protein [Clostridium sp.]|uniref:protein phosphatase 2C domain-containing protein n=1 Tax=Clostridium sp. TaxID=1506 RepID=UPI003D6D0096